MITGEGLGLRAPEACDRQRWLELLHDPDQLAYSSAAFLPVPGAVQDLDERVRTAGEQMAAGEPSTFVVVAPDRPGHFLGIVAWRWGALPAMRIGDIGYGVHADSRGRGVGRRAVRLFTRWLTLDEEGPRLARVQLEHSVENPSSCRVALAAGFEREGHRRSYLVLRDAAAPGGERRHDVCLHGFVTGD
jgi:RimJ/RimL family protein N-acetyltransferase